MNKLWIAVCILLVLAAGVFCSCRYVEALGGEMLALLDQAETAARGGDWTRAEELSEQAERHWETGSGVLNVILRHSDTDRVRTGLAEVRGYLAERAREDYTAASARLRAAVRALVEMERLTWSNLL